MINQRLIFLLIGLMLVVTPLASAAGWFGLGGGGYYSSPLFFLENEWVMFGIVFIIFFAIIFYTVNKSFKNPMISGVIALGLGLFISIALAQRGWLNSYMGSEIGAWLLIVAALISIAFAIKFSYDSFGRIGAVAAIVIIWYVLHSNPDPYDILPPELMTDTFTGIYEFVSSWFGLIIAVIAGGIIIAARRQRGIGRLGDAFDKMFGR